jgi:acyl-lipid omega-6 desaturase (Delta-12 desaturase)
MTITTTPRTDETPSSGLASVDSLRPVLAVIPEECFVRSTARGFRAIARAVVIYAAAIAALFVARSWWQVAIAWLAVALAIAGLFVLGHDAAHGALFDSPRRNRRVGRWLMVPSMHVYESWVIGHNRIHHGHTLRQGMDFVWHPVTVDEYRSFSTIQRVRHRLEWSMFGAGLYYARAVWWDKMVRFDPPERSRATVRRDERFVFGISIATAVGIFAIGWVGLGTGGGVVGAGWLVLKLLVVPTFLFMWTIGFAVYVHHIAPDVKWWPRRTWTRYHGQMEGTTVLRIGRFWNLFFYNIFVHTPHHVDVRIPWYHLPKAAAAIEAAFPVVDRKLRVRDYVAHTRACKLYDFDEQRWVRYPTRATVSATK